MATPTRIRDRAYETAAAFQLVSDPTRCRLLLLLSKRPAGMCVYEIAEEIDLTHSAASHQLGKLERSGIVEGYREGQTVCYMLARGAKAKALLRVLKVMHSIGRV